MTATAVMSGLGAEPRESAARGAAIARLDAWLDCDADTLRRTYEAARVPRIPDVRGALRGRMLAWPVAGRRTNAALRLLAGSSRFPWRGKSFFPHDDDRGEGKNRVFSDRLALFRFETRIERSRAGDFDAVQLDYDLPENPFFIRAIKDEIREVEPGLWLGQAYLHAGGKDTLVLYFGLAVPA
ncbi:MAG: hypothetical protein JNL38_04820 [Myxococcales bacterium]|jgi:hypothetical protein|nr:hypothetical protein [Myxococcales bacterium]